VLRIKAGGYSAVIEAAFQIIPEQLHYLRPDFLCGTDPIFAGLHTYANTFDGRSYADTAHCCYPFNQWTLAKTQRRTTIVLPRIPNISTVIHEFGHVVDEHFRFEHTAQPVTRYAQSNRYEAFAEAFTAWLLPGYPAPPDDATIALLAQATM
jgi:hypothetical protein